MVSGRVRGYKTEAVVLRHRPLGEADRLLVLLSPTMGKVRAVARGVRRSKSRMAGHLEPLNRVSASLSEGRDLDIVTEAEAVDVYPAIRRDLAKLSAAMFVAELVDGFSADHSPGQAMYRLLTNALDAMEGAKSPMQLVRYFQTRLLGMSGFGPELRQCVSCHEALEPGDHVFASSEGGVVCPSCRSRSEDALIPVSLNVLKVLRFFQREPMEKALGLRLDTKVLTEAARVLDGYTRFLLERELKTADCLDLVGT
ncbi:MAG: DNA repair protein RecO, partial [SAR202 cluster bacterium]|nr:DNA repair protein RecO [SAR202 cluster bacterium]